MQEVLDITGLNTRQEAVELGLKTLLKQEKKSRIRSSPDTLTSKDDQDTMRTD